MQWVDGASGLRGADGPHLLTDRVSNQSVPFDIQPGVVTRVILRIEVALGSGSGAGSGPATTGGGESTQTPDPLDFLNGLVTDVLVTDELSGIRMERRMKVPTIPIRSLSTCWGVWKQTSWRRSLKEFRSWAFATIATMDCRGRW